MSTYDLIVVGAGPAGSSAAITARRCGARVLLMERASFPRQRVCGEFVSAESLGLLSQLLTSKWRGLLDEAVVISKARMFLDGRTLVTPVKPPARSIARLDLDLALWDSAQECGVETRDRITAQAISRNGSFQVSSSGGDFKARAVINATGRWSNFRSSLPEPIKPAQRWIGIKAHFYEASPPDSVDLYFFQGGYCGVQPVDLYTNGSSPRVNASAIVRAGLATSLPQVFGLHPLLRQRTRDWKQLGDSVTTSPIVFGQPDCVVENVWRAGDAAGFVDPFVGDGISLALRSGALAGESLVPFFAGAITLDQAAAHYRSQYGSRLAPVFRASSGIRRLLRLPRSLRAPLLLVLSKTSALRWIVTQTR